MSAGKTFISKTFQQDCKESNFLNNPSRLIQKDTRQEQLLTILIFQSWVNNAFYIEFSQSVRNCSRGFALSAIFQLIKSLSMQMRSRCFKLLYTYLCMYMYCNDWIFDGCLSLKTIKKSSFNNLSFATLCINIDDLKMCFLLNSCLRKLILCVNFFIR